MWSDISSEARVEKAASMAADTPFTDEVNNHVHTAYSFSPYTPAEAALAARNAGLKAVGIMDHDSVSGAREFIESCRRLGIGSTVGFEVRVNGDGTVMEGRRINNPDTDNILYMAGHGVAEPRLEEADAFLQPLRELRNRRNRKQLSSLNRILEEKDLPSLNFEEDVLPVSFNADGGSVTERHILYALTIMLTRRWNRGDELVSNLQSTFQIEIPGKIGEHLRDPQNPHYLYDLLGILKSTLLPRFYIDPDKNECLNVKEAVDFARSIGAIPAYAYLGDIKESPTGDKKAQTFEDSWLDELVPELKRIGFTAITYMPPRNSKEQLDRIMSLAARNGLMQISGVDINSSRQSFHCPEIMQPGFSHLIDATWALIAHETLSAENLGSSLFSVQTMAKYPDLSRRIKEYGIIGRKLFETGA